MSSKLTPQNLRIFGEACYFLSKGCILLSKDKSNFNQIFDKTSETYKELKTADELNPFKDPA